MACYCLEGGSSFYQRRKTHSSRIEQQESHSRITRIVLTAKIETSTVLIFCNIQSSIFNIQFYNMTMVIVEILNFLLGVKPM